MDFNLEVNKWSVHGETIRQEYGVRAGEMEKKEEDIKSAELVSFPVAENLRDSDSGEFPSGDTIGPQEYEVKMYGRA